MTPSHTLSQRPYPERADTWPWTHTSWETPQAARSPRLPSSAAAAFTLHVTSRMSGGPEPGFNPNTTPGSSMSSRWSRAAQVTPKMPFPHTDYFGLKLPRNSQCEKDTVTLLSPPASRKEVSHGEGALPTAGGREAPLSRTRAV